MISLWNHPKDYSAEFQSFDLYFVFIEAQNHNEFYPLLGVVLINAVKIFNQLLKLVR